MKRVVKPSTSSVSAEQKKLSIQLGVCKRMLKEVKSYEKEVAENEATLQKMRDENRDIHDIRKFEEVLQESYMMIPDSNRRLESSIETLKNVMDEIFEEPSVDESLKKEADDLITTFEKKATEVSPQELNSETI